MAKRTHASVTEEPCTCNYLQNAADDSRNPITFDSPTGEYQFSFDGAMLVVYHCPFCGGAAPESKRELLFEQIPDTEQERLGELLHGITTIDAAIKKFGKPDFEGVSTSKFPKTMTMPHGSNTTVTFDSIICPMLRKSGLPNDLMAQSTGTISSR